MAQDNWLPGRRDDQLFMAKNWDTVLAQKAAGWNVPPAEVTDLDTLSAVAEAALTLAKSPASAPG